MIAIYYQNDGREADQGCMEDGSWNEERRGRPNATWNARIVGILKIKSGRSVKVNNNDWGILSE